MSGRVLTRAAAVVCLAGLVTGCGGSSSKSSAKSGTAAKSSSTPGTTSKSAAPEATGVKADSKFCKLVVEELKTFGDAVNKASSSPADLAALVPKLREANRQLLDAAPGELKGDVAIVAKATDGLLNAYQQAGGDISKVPPEATQAFGTPEVKAASEHELAYIKDKCGIDTSGGGGDSQPSAEPTG